MAKLEEIARTISLHAQPGMKPKALMAMVKEHHPEASKKDVSRGAFYAVILAAERDPNKVSVLHDMAMAARSEGAGLSEAGGGLLGFESQKAKRSKKTKH
ncbi:hypothetical protein GCM10011390_44120 [Aureimonas endophytica]|uniref:Uncharacterized protein n=1 Tax=Aureimonas endophytica TaxID=2027858 RepID=A0A916ZZN9_9HYPH|nr:hypothetical protein [Aureimonas endophytica]GGE20046.1 hypothetical protein GCM10011390_44120 [Aureimonas endophytica]